jgi:hypothetical protein
MLEGGHLETSAAQLLKSQFRSDFQQGQVHLKAAAAVNR